MGIILGLAAALLYGGSDFGGGLLSRQLGSLRVNVAGATAATVLTWAVLLASGAPEPSLRAVAWGLASGLGGGAGTLVLYRGLALPITLNAFRGIVYSLFHAFVLNR